MSQGLRRGAPRWSVASGTPSASRQVAAPALIAALPGSSASVWVGPPLLASGPRFAAAPSLSPASGAAMHWPLRPIRLLPSEVSVPLLWHRAFLGARGAHPVGDQRAPHLQRGVADEDVAAVARRTRRRWRLCRRRCCRCRPDRRLPAPAWLPASVTEAKVPAAPLNSAASAATAPKPAPPAPPVVGRAAVLRVAAGAARAAFGEVAGDRHVGQFQRGVGEDAGSVRDSPWPPLPGVPSAPLLPPCPPGEVCPTLPAISESVAVIAAVPTPTPAPDRRAAGAAFAGVAADRGRAARAGVAGEPDVADDRDADHAPARGSRRSRRRRRRRRGRLRRRGRTSTPAAPSPPSPPKAVLPAITTSVSFTVPEPRTPPPSARAPSSPLAPVPTRVFAVGGDQVAAGDRHPADRQPAGFVGVDHPRADRRLFDRRRARAGAGDRDVLVDRERARC